MKRGRYFYSVATTLLSLFMISGNAFADPDTAEQDAKAIQVLKSMDAYTNSMDKFVIKAESYLDASIGEGLIVSNPYETTVSVVRGISLHSVSKSGLYINEIFLNKGALTVYSGERKYYTQAEVPKPLDAGLLFALEELDVETPLLDLLILNSLDKLVTPRVEVFYVTGEGSVRGVDAHHVLLSGPLADLQVWIAKGDKPLPIRTMMTYRYGEGMPRSEVFLNWREVDAFDKSEFVFVAPEGATEIDFIDSP